MILSLDAITKIAGGSTCGASVALLATYMLFTPEQQFARHVAEERTTTVQNLVSELQKEPAGDYHDTLCRTLEQTLTAICLDSKDHPFCVDRAVLMAKAGCR